MHLLEWLLLKKKKASDRKDLEKKELSCTWLVRIQIGAAIRETAMEVSQQLKIEGASTLCDSMGGTGEHYAK